MLHSKNSYGDEIACGLLLDSSGAVVLGPDNEPLPNLERRTDRQQNIEAFMEWKIDKRVEFRVTADRLHRNSSCNLSDYDVNRVMAGVSFGWF